MRAVRRVGPYLYRMTANACADRLRQRRRGIFSLEEIRAEKIPSTQAGVLEQAVAAEGLRRVEQLLAHLPPRQAEVIRLRVLDELPLAEIAEVIGRSSATIKARLRYGLQKLRQIISGSKEGKR
jgi:RNA polymerase sigma-70 factor (ECF subfamily)